MKTSADQFHKENPDFSGPVPADAVTASASGLDPEISLENAEAQAARVAKARGVDATAIGRLIDSTKHDRDLGFLGEARRERFEAEFGVG